jgi:hypothetical protein
MRSPICPLAVWISTAARVRRFPGPGACAAGPELAIGARRSSFCDRRSTAPTAPICVIHGLVPKMPLSQARSQRCRSAACAVAAALTMEACRVPNRGL